MLFLGSKLTGRKSVTRKWSTKESDKKESQSGNDQELNVPQSELLDCAPGGLQMTRQLELVVGQRCRNPKWNG